MSKVIATSIERMASDISAYNEQLTAVSNAYKDAWEAVQALNATWSGPAHETLEAQFLEDQLVTKDLMDSLRSYQEELISAKKEYETCEKNVASLISSMEV